MRPWIGTLGFLAFLAISSAAWAAEEERPARLPRPSAEVLAASERAMRELFDADLARAVKPSEKAAAARRILDVALDTPDGDRDADRYAAFLLARETALAGRDKATAFAASRAIAERYEQPCEGDPLAKGDELWKAASAKLGAERLRIEAEAAEWYGYALDGMSENDLTRRLIEKRLTVENMIVKKSNVADSKTVWEIKARDDWQRTVCVKRGQYITIEAEGEWRWGIPAKQVCGPDGVGDYGYLEIKLPDEMEMKIGRGLAFRASKSGYLCFRMKDTNRNDNDGCLRVYVSVK